MPDNLATALVDEAPHQDRPRITEPRPSVGDQAGTQGQATFGMSNLRPERTGLPFIVFISQRDGAQHDVRVKVGRMPRLKSSEMGTYALRPRVEWRAGLKLDRREEDLLGRWIGLNVKVIQDYWDGEIEYTEDAVAALIKI